MASRSSTIDMTPADYIAVSNMAANPAYEVVKHDQLQGEESTYEVMNS